MIEYYCRKIILRENHGINRELYPIVLQLGNISANPESVNWNSLRIKDREGTELTYQLDSFEEGIIRNSEDEIVFQISLKPHSIKEIFFTYNTDLKETVDFSQSDLKITSENQKTTVENSRFFWELTNAENAEFFLKHNGHKSESWDARIWTYAGQGHNRVTPMHDFHYQRRRFLNEVKTCQVLSAGPVRAVIKLFYDFIHFEENLDVERIIKIYSNSPLIEKSSTSVSGEPGIVLATMIGKMGPHTLADGTFCGAEKSYPINSPRIYPKISGDVPLLFEKEMNFQPIGTAHDPTTMGTAAHKTIGEINGYTWGSIWNPRNKQGKGEIAHLNDVSGFFLGWEQDRDASSIHPLTNRSFADFVFHCTSKRTFKHYTTFFKLGSLEESPHQYLDHLTASIGNPIEIIYEDLQCSSDQTNWRTISDVNDPHALHNIPADDHDREYKNTDIKLLCPFKAYIDENFTVEVVVSNYEDEWISGQINVLVNDQKINEQGLSIPTQQSESIQLKTKIAEEGQFTITAVFFSEKIHIVTNHHIDLFARPELPSVDICSMLSRPEKRTLHGNLLRYWGGQLDIYWEEIEHESLGFTHAWLFDGKSWGSLPERDWEFWRKEQTAFGSIYDHDEKIFYESPKAIKSRWEPGNLELSFEVNNIELIEKKYICNDVLSDIIKMRNTSDQEKHFSLIFRGKGHGMSEALSEDDGKVIRIKNHAYAYTGLNIIFTASAPFDAWQFSNNREELVSQLSKGKLQETSECYGNPVHYAFMFDIRLKSGEQNTLTLGCSISNDYEESLKDIRTVIRNPEHAAEAVRWEWNYWFNDQVPRFSCDNALYNDLFYYIWFAYRCNVYDVGRGWYKYPYVAPTSTTYFNTMFGWDSALHTMIGKWLRNPEVFVYGNQKNWSLVQPPCGFLPEIFGSDWRQTWTGGNLTLLATSLHEMYLNNGDLDLVKFMYPVLKKYEQWRACEIEYSPYWMDYHNNIKDYQERKDSFAAGEPWVDTQILYYNCLADIAAWAGDTDYQKQLRLKAEISTEKFQRELSICSDHSWDETSHATHIGGSLFWSNGKYANPERVEELIQKIFDPDIYGMTPPMPGWPINYKRPGDGWDHGDSVTTVFFTIEGLFRYGKYEEALKLLDRMVEISFIDTEDGLKPTAPEYWDEKANPWGCVEYAWQGLLTNLMIERICGIRPNVPERQIVVEPNFPEKIRSTEISVPITNQWIHFKQEIKREKTTGYTLTVNNAIFDTTLRLRIPGNTEVLSATIDGNKAEYTKSEDYVEVVIDGKKDFTVVVEYN